MSTGDGPVVVVASGMLPAGKSTRLSSACLGILPAREHGSQRSSPGSSRIQRDDPCVPRVHVPKVSPPSPVGRLQTCAPAKIRERRKKRREIGQASRGWTMSVARTTLSLSRTPALSILRLSFLLRFSLSPFYRLFLSFLFLPCVYRLRLGSSVVFHVFDVFSSSCSRLYFRGFPSSFSSIFPSFRSLSKTTS